MVCFFVVNVYVHVYNYAQVGSVLHGRDEVCFPLLCFGKSYSVVIHSGVFLQLLKLFCFYFFLISPDGLIMKQVAFYVGVCFVYICTKFMGIVMQVLPGKMLDFLDAPVPFLVSFLSFSLNFSLFPSNAKCKLAPDSTLRLHFVPFLKYSNFTTDMGDETNSLAKVYNPCIRPTL